MSLPGPQSLSCSRIPRCNHQDAVRLIRKSIDASVYLLADHLDAMLAAGEDLLKVTPDADAGLSGSGHDDVAGLVAAQRRFVDEVRTLELTLAMRGLQARERADTLRRQDRRVAPIAGLFIGGTAPLADAARDLGDSTRFDFQTGKEIVAYLRSRALIPAESAGHVSLSQIFVDGRFLIGGHIELGTLLDLAATFLDALELFYELYDEDEGAREARWADLPPLRPDS